MLSNRRTTVIFNLHRSYLSHLLSNRRVKVNLANNSFSGPLCKEIAFFTRLQGLYTWNNGFTEEIPEELRTLEGLVDLEMYGNNFTLPEPMMNDSTFLYIYDHRLAVEKLMEILFDGAPIQQTLRSVANENAIKATPTFEEMESGMGIGNIHNTNKYRKASAHAAAAAADADAGEGHDGSSDL